MSHPKSTGGDQEGTYEAPEQARYLNDLYQVTSDTSRSFEEKVEQLLTVGCDYFDVTIGMLNRERTDRFEVEQMVGSHPVIEEGAHTPPTDEHYCRHVVATGETACVHDAGEAGWEDDALYHEFGLECYAGVKVTVGSERYGTLSFSDRSPRERAFTAADRTFLELMGQCVNYELERERRVNQLTALNALSRELMAIKTADEISERVVEAAKTTLDLPITAIALYDDQCEDLRPVAETDAAEEILRATGLLGDEGGICGDPHTEAMPRRVPDPLAGVDATDLPPVTELAVFPLGDRGALVTGSTATGGFSPTDFDFVETVAANTESALDRAERERMLERQNDRLDSFAGMLAHELRNPLNIAQIYHGQTSDGDEDEVGAALSRIEEMIDVLLVTARGSDSNIDWESVALPEAALEVWGDVSAEAADLVVETEQVVRSDPIHLRHLLENLFENSIDHGNESVTVRVGDLEEGFYVADDGSGIPAEKYETVFEAGHTTDADGIGLGLTFVAQLAETYDWECTLTESAAGGARFEFTNLNRDSPA